MLQEEKTKKVALISSAIGGLGFAGGLGFSLYKKKKFWPVVGIAVASGLIGSMASAAISNLIIKVDKPVASGGQKEILK